MQPGRTVELSLIERHFDGSEKYVAITSHSKDKTHLGLVEGGDYYALVDELLKGYLVVGVIIASSNYNASLEGIIRWRAYDLNILTEA